MALLRHSARIIFPLALSLAFVQMASGQSPTPAPQPSTIADAPAGPPITHAELEEYLRSAGTLDGGKLLAKYQMDASHKRLPAWFPPAVWAEVERKVMAVDLVEVYLPVYRKYLSSETLSGLLPIYQGPTGEEFAHVSTQRVMDAIRQGSEGHAADTQAANAMDANGEDAILARRIKEFTPEQRAAYVKAAAAYKAVLKPLDDEQNAAFSQKVQEVWRATVKEHNSEIVAAQNAASHAHSAKQ